MDFFSHTAAVATANLFSAALFVYNLRYSSLLMTTCCLPSSLCFCLNILPLSPPAGWSRLHRHGTGAQPIPVHVCSSSAHQMLASLLRLRWPHQVGGRSDPGRLQPVQSSQSDQGSERHNRGLFVGRVQVKCCFVFFLLWCWGRTSNRTQHVCHHKVITRCLTADSALPRWSVLIFPANCW